MPKPADQKVSLPSTVFAFHAPALLKQFNTNSILANPKNEKKEKE